MKHGSYEFHAYQNEKIPIIYNKWTIIDTWDYYMHWHENIEILFITHGKLEIRMDDAVYYADEGDVAVVNSGAMHYLSVVGERVDYDCLIVDKNFCEQYGFFVDEKHIEEVFRDDELTKLNERIRWLLGEKPAYYEPEVIACLIKIMTIFFRSHTGDSVSYGANKNLAMVKAGIKYIDKHFKEQIGVEDVSLSVGYSKYYFSRCFKEVTGCTVNEYINRVRIKYADKKFREEKTSVSDVAALLGFSDISYFTKIFKKYTGKLPSEVGKQRN